MLLEKTANNVIGVVKVTPRKRTKRTPDGGTAGLFHDINSNKFAYVRVVKLPDDMPKDIKEFLDLDNKERIYLVRKENVGASMLTFVDADTKGDIILIDPYAIMGLISLESNELFEEFGGTEAIIEE